MRDWLDLIIIIWLNRIDGLAHSSIILNKHRWNRWGKEYEIHKGLGIGTAAALTISTREKIPACILHKSLWMGVNQTSISPTVSLLIYFSCWTTFSLYKSTHYDYVSSVDESAQEAADEVMSLVDELGVAINSLYDEPMPASTAWSVSNWVWTTIWPQVEQSVWIRGSG